MQKRGEHFRSASATAGRDLTRRRLFMERNSSIRGTKAVRERGITEWVFI